METPENKFIYNLTFNLETSIENEWKKWFEEDFLTILSRESKLVKRNTYKVLADHSPGTVTFSTQLEATSIMEIQLFKLNAEQHLLQELHKKFGEKCLLFPTILEKV